MICFRKDAEPFSSESVVLSEEGLVIVMTPFMEHLNRLYGKTLLIDSTYNISNGALILFMGVVLTNVTYQPVFAVLCYEDTKEMTKRALTWLRNEKAVHPVYTITDKSQAELSAIAEVFPGEHFTIFYA